MEQVARIISNNFYRYLTADSSDHHIHVRSYTLHDSIEKQIKDKLKYETKKDSNK
jgi:hypothetical protein